MIQLARILNKLGTNSVRELFKSTGLLETSVIRQAQAAEINLFYRRNGGFRGPFAFPVTEVQYNPDQSAVKRFSGGTIRSALSTPQGEKMTAVQVRFIGFHCISESNEWSDSDEPYFILGVAGANGTRTVKFGPYSDVDRGENRYEAAYVVSPSDRITPPIVLGVVAMEHDEGTPEEAAAKVRKAMEDIVGKFEQAAGSFMGLEAGSHIMPEWSRDILFGWVAEGFAAVFGLEDDEVGKNSVVLFDNKADLLEWRAPAIIGKHGGNEYNLVIPIDGGDSEGRYTLYFKVDLFEINVDILPY